MRFPRSRSRLAFPRSSRPELLGLGVGVAALLAPLLSACGIRSSSAFVGGPGADAGGTSAPGTVCVAGQQVSCECPGGEVGVETCDAHGFGPCVCGPGPGPAPTSTTPVPPPPPVLLDAGRPSVTPPAPPSVGTTPAWPGASTFAVHHVHLGDELDSSGNLDWYRYAYDLDGKSTTARSNDVCTPAPGANPGDQTDGPGGVDNSFGANIVPLLAGIAPNPSQGVTYELVNGVDGWLFETQGLATDPGQSSNGLQLSYFLGALFSAPPNTTSSHPTFTLADDWPLDPASVASPVGVGGVLGTPVIADDVFPGAYVVGGEVVSGAPGTIDLVLGIGDQPLRLHIQHATVTFRHASATHASSGIIAGVIATQDLVDATTFVTGSVGNGLCNAGARASLARTIAQASDIMVDGSNEAGIPCDGVSVGIGFDADQIQSPQFAGQSPAPRDPCDAG